MRSDFPAPHISLDVARHVLWHNGDYTMGLQPGTFVERLLYLLNHADLENRAKLRSVFPEYVDAHQLAVRQHWGVQHLRDVVLRQVAKADQ